MSMIFNCETFRENLIFLPAYSLIMWFMRSPKNLTEAKLILQIKIEDVGQVNFET